MKRLTLLLFSLALIPLAGMSNDGVLIAINGSIVVENKKTCVLDAPAGVTQVLFTYRKDKIPNYYYIWNNVVDYDGTKNGIASQYFKHVDYRVTCSFKPGSDSSIRVSYSLNGDAKVANSGSRTLWYYLESSQSENAGFIVRRKNDNDWLNFRGVSNQSEVYNIIASEFTKLTNGNYEATMSYAIAFTGADLNSQNYSDELIKGSLVGVGAYSRNITLNVEYD
ncbi:hypothetical protein CD201_06315 [Hafnia alvei]|uniref:hypothetical protein n=1 Tax=Hafnia TaxID=568 RepID=UPI000BBB1A77|nr:MULTISPECIES: hypothetical protein [Hafnia]AWV44212.1 hypothetical protein CD201_06315 [Hafnia alvei]MCE9872015.1 hypothetical protein [Hafnia alvei]TBL89944.1 hypothetical protein EYY95_06140 [Hafnia alvei]